MIDDVAARLLLLLALVAVASAGWLLRHRRDGRFVPTGVSRAPDDREREVVDAADLGAPLGTRATFVQFSTPTCATCAQVRRALADLAQHEPGVVHVEVRADERLALVRRLRVLRVPTVLLVGPDGAIRSRTSGPMTHDQARRALADQEAVTHPGGTRV